MTPETQSAASPPNNGNHGAVACAFPDPIHDLGDQIADLPPKDAKELWEYLEEQGRQTGRMR